MKKNKIIEEDISNRFFFLKLKYFFSFYFFFFFRCLYAILFNLFYIYLYNKELTINKSLKSDNKNYLIKDVLFVGDSTISFPRQEYSFPYLFFNNGNMESVDILAKPSLNTRDLFNYINPILSKKNKKYDLIFITCFLNEIINTNTKAEEFEASSQLLIQLLKTKLKKSGKIIYIYGNFSLHPIVPNNYFKKYFNYKTHKFITLLKKYENDSLKFSLLMNFKADEDQKHIKSYFYKDGLHFSNKGQVRLFEDLKRNLF